MHFNAVLSEFFHQKSGGELNLVFAAVRVRACALVRGKLLTQRATVPPTISSVFYTRLVPSGSPYIES